MVCDVLMLFKKIPSLFMHFQLLEIELKVQKINITFGKWLYIIYQ